MILSSCRRIELHVEKVENLQWYIVKGNAKEMQRRKRKGKRGGHNLKTWSKYGDY